MVGVKERILTFLYFWATHNHDFGVKTQLEYLEINRTMS